MRIAHLGAFDHDNYGDLLFPHVLEWRLASLGAEFVHAAPTDQTTPVWRDARPAVAISSLPTLPNFDAVIVGGGDGIVDGQWWTDRWNDRPLAGATALPSLWAGAAHLAASHGARLLWNAPGVPFAMRGAAAELLRWSTGLADYLSVRDPGSATVLAASGVTTQVHRVPDTAFELSRMWPAESLAEEFSALAKSIGFPAAKRFVVIQCNEALFHDARSEVAKRIAAFCHAQGLGALVVEVCPWTATSFSSDLTKDLTAAGVVCGHVARPSSLRQIAACFARAELYAGCSFHGMISAWSYGHPAIAVVAPESIVRKKISGTLELAGLPPWSLVSDWSEAMQLAAQALRDSAGPWHNTLARVGPLLDLHWHRVVSVLTHPPPARTGALERLRAMNVVRPGTTEIYGALLGQRMEELFATNADLRAQLRDLETARVTERRAAEAALEAQRQSLSWRITAPLRALHELIAGPRNPDRM